MSKRPRIETLLRRFRSSRRPTTGPLTLHRRRLLTEPLEDRRMLSVVTVNNNLDLVNGDTSSIANLIATDGGDGISLREALDAANNTAGADDVNFDVTLAGNTITLGGTQLTISDDVTVTGLGASDLTIDAAGTSRAIIVTNNATADISGLTMTGGSMGRGGGLRNDAGSTTTLTAVVIDGNTATVASFDAGGGIWNAGDLTITDSTISNNSTTAGSSGGVFNKGNLTVTNSTVSGNSAYATGGGIFNYNNGDLTVTDSTVSGNSASGSGGGIWNAGDLTITDSTISNNSTTVGSGGGVFNIGNLTVTDSTVSGNSAYGSGGGIFSNTDSDYVTTVTTITGSTISGNTAAQGGGVCNNNGLTDIRYSTITLNDASTSGDGVWSFGDSATRTDVGSSIIAGNVGNDDVHTNGVTNEFVSLGYNLIGGGNDAGAFIAAGDQTGVTDPMLGPLADNGGPTQTHALLAGSPALNAGDPAAVAGVGGVPLYDQRGAPFGRVVGVIDIGAVESLHNFIVDTAVDESDGDYSPGDLSLREALELTNANPGADVIDFAPGLAGSTINLVLGQLTISDDVTINGLGASDLTIDAQGASRVMAVTNSATADISGLTLTGGNAGRGGGLRNYAGSTTTLTAVVIDTNTATTSSGGGGIWNAGNLTITDSTISNNSTTTGGGGGILSSGNLTVADSTVSGNSAFSGGGGVLNSGNLTMTDSTVSGNSASGNSASGNGGGVYNLGDLTLTNSTVSGNSASVSGGGIWSSTSSDYVTTVTTITGSTISGNTAAQGGGVFNLNGLTTIHYSTITLNDASTSGDGVWSFGDSYTRTDVGSSIIAGNVGNDDVHTNGVSNEFVSLGYNLIGGGNDAGAFGATGDQTGVTDPMLGALTDNGGPTFTHALLPGSPAIDAGDPTAVAGVGGVPLYDQRGMNYERVQAGRIDIGAYELLLADGNLDGQVDGLDYLIWASHYPDNPAADPPGTPQNGDYNNDGKVDGVDYLLWASQYLEGTPAVAASQPAASTQEQLAAVDTTFANAYSVGATVQDWQVSQAFDAVLNHDTVLKHKDK